MSIVRTRYSPSPTSINGQHCGGIRTALFSWLYAKQHNGVFIVRSEDTDRARSSLESEKLILKSLLWCGLDYQEGILPDGSSKGSFAPYRQSDCLDEYKIYVDKLIKEGKAYRCYCSSQELDAQREEWFKKTGKEGWKYPGTCRNRKDFPDKEYIVRFIATTEGTTDFNDKIFGHISVPNIENQDFVIMRSDGFPLYNLACVVDDIRHKITLVSRGTDHLMNTVPQLLLYKAFGINPPQFAHLPLILGKDKKKLSKRENSASINFFIEKGFTPQACLNYLVKFGWASGNKEIFSVKELIEMFSFEACGKKSGIFDVEKFESIQYSHMKSPALTPNETYANYLSEFLAKKGYNTDPQSLIPLIPLVRSRAKTFVDAANEIEPLIQENLQIDNDAALKHFTPDTKANLKQFETFLRSLDNWNAEILKTATHDFLQKNNLQMKDIGQSLRVSLTGKSQSPDLFMILDVLGKERSLSRISANCQ